MSRRKIVVAFVTVGALASTGVAVSYWTGGGSGTGSATTATGLAAVTVVQTSTVTGLAPGSGTQALSGTFNNTNGSAVWVSTVSATVTVTQASGAVGSCDASDYVIAGSGAVGALVPVGTGTGSWGNLTIAFDNDLGANQDGCKGATLAIAYTVA